jgi:hypothetical protein
MLILPGMMHHIQLPPIENQEIATGEEIGQLNPLHRNSGNYNRMC